MRPGSGPARPPADVRARRTSADLELLARAKRGDRKARGFLVEEHMGLARSLAWQYRDLGVPVEDLVQEGAVGLLEAIDRFDPRYGASFATYAFWRVRQSITHALTDRGRLLRLPKEVVERRRALSGVTAAMVNAGRTPTAAGLAAATGLTQGEVVEALAAPTAVASLDQPLADGTTLESAIADPAATDPEAAALATVEAAALERALGRLPERQRTVVRSHFGLDGAPHTFAEVGEELAVSPARAREIERSALDALAADLGPAAAHGR